MALLPVHALAADSAALELELARSRALYLVVDPDLAQLSIRIRGVEVAVVSGRAAWLATGAGEAPAQALPQLPTVWRVTAGASESWRQVIAPERLEDYREEARASTAPAHLAGEERPVRYVVETDSGWRLAVGGPVAELVPIGFAARLSRGWRRLVGQPDPPLPPTLVLETAAADAQRIVHLFEPGTPLLVARDATAAVSWADAADR